MKRRKIILSILAGFFLSVALKSTVFEIYQVPSESMLPTLKTGDRIWVNKLQYQVRFPFLKWPLWQQQAVRRGDLVVARYASDPDLAYVKRVIALPGEVIAIAEDQVLIDGCPLNETYLSPVEMESGKENFPAKRIPEGYLFVMGDNRYHSIDSRVIGLVRLEDIEGKVLGTIWPIQF